MFWFMNANKNNPKQIVVHRREARIPPKGAGNFFIILLTRGSNLPYAFIHIFEPQASRRPPSPSCAIKIITEINSNTIARSIAFSLYIYRHTVASLKLEGGRRQENPSTLPILSKTYIIFDQGQK